MIVLAVEFLYGKFKAKDAKEETLRERSEREAAEAELKKEDKEGTCTFWFVDAARLRDWTPSKSE